ncbi:potassium efflux system KefA protein [Klebsiella michiganensis]|uniref:Potassium efflux system KefA protein n=1 Tax=Klebsiella michiganensis TaxID=1134687 RepID=A0A7H4M1M8_9ENTR|nr:potassium efflux system KefA protein [Klebsiella michiganensis]
MRSELAQKESEQLDAWLQALRNQLNNQRQREAEKALESTELLAENSENLPPDIVAQFKVNRELSQALNQQAQRMDLIASQQRQATNQTLQVRQALNTLREQSPVAGLFQSAWRSPARAGGAAAGNPAAAAAGYRNGAAARAAFTL